MLIVVLGGGIDLQGNLPPHVHLRLDKAIELFQEHPDSRIVLSGRYSFLYGKDKPPFTEAKKMSEYIFDKGIAKEKILLEELSKDSIGNAYYLKINIFIPERENQGMIITSEFHIKRIRYIFDKVFGDNYSFTFVGVSDSLPSEQEGEVVERQKQLLLKTEEMLSNMKDGDHDFLKDKLYKVAFYREKRPEWVSKFVAKGK